MVASMAYMILYLSYGVMTVRFLLPRHRPLNRLWLGMSLGLLEEMWLPALCAFFVGFTAKGHVFAAAAAAVITLLCFVLRDRRNVAGWDKKEDTLLRQLLLVALPLTVLSAYLQYTHVMRVDADGNWHVGQSTFGDLPMHLSFISNLVGKRFPADYPFYPGYRLSYPFLTDSLSSTFLLFGASLQAATVVPAVLMMALCYMGVMVLAREMTAGKKTVVLATLLFFLNGGLGFFYSFDLAGGRWEAETVTGTEAWKSSSLFERIGALFGGISDQSGQIVPGYFSGAEKRIQAILNGFYTTPTNQPAPNNLRWSNVVCDLMIPQRTLLGGWCMVIPCFYLLDAALRPRKIHEDRGLRPLILLGVWGGALPLIHTHSFLALGLMSLGAMIYDLIHGDPKAILIRRPRRVILGRYLVYGAVALALALPQLICFTFSQAFSGESGNSFLALHFNWVNVQEYQVSYTASAYQMKDLYFWFYIKNIGLPFIVLILALFEKNPRHRRMFAMALPVILAAETIRFQPNDYDNNKLLYLSWLLCCMIAADWFGTVWRRLKGMRGRAALGVLAAVVLFLSAGLTVWRETVSDYEAFSADEVEAGEFARDCTPEDAVFMTGADRIVYDKEEGWKRYTEHLIPVLSIGGKTIVCGPDTWLYFHGFNTDERRADIEDFYTDPGRNAEILEKYGVDYIYVSRYERETYDPDEDALAGDYPVVFENDEVTIYRVPEG